MAELLKGLIHVARDLSGWYICMYLKIFSPPIRSPLDLRLFAYPKAFAVTDKLRGDLILKKGNDVTVDV
jgi:hypothetical protein